ncbi:hypothetical protein RSOLAG22IIIB_11341 [Rhizoctonia solani]|uniref:Uncharacterized protein n=1 Tax=Rhizoctonia solani TaxID=456999 RepID=A0A0K6G7Z2_9AGAM|nr:hypothetical protein RSOLAG22IIIB_11341 [Rhizoctonia solani]
MDKARAQAADAAKSCLFSIPTPITPISNSHQRHNHDLHSRSDGWTIQFKFNDQSKRTAAGKTSTDNSCTQSHFNGAPNDPGNTEQVSRGLNSPPIQHTGLPRHRSPSIRHPSPELPHDDSYARTPSPRGRRRAKQQKVIDDLPVFDPNDQREHRFDELLPGPAFPDLDVDDELLDPNLRSDEPEEDDPFDEFVLPRGHNEPPGEEQLPPLFGLPWENQAENPNPEPEPEPDEEAHPAEYCVAFQEHRLVRNAYVDAAVQKILYGVNQRALTHHLEAAQRQLRDNPNVPADDLARMALTIRTVERRLGLDPRDIITTYTLCPLCGRLYHSNYIADANTSTPCCGDAVQCRSYAFGCRRFHFSGRQ